MKKVLSLLLVLALLLPAAALADQTYDLGGFLRARVPDTAYVDVVDRVDGAVFATIIPDPTNVAGVYANINITWGEGVTRDDLDFTAEEFGEYVVSSTAVGLADQGIAVSNEELIHAEMNREEGTITLDADYSGAGVDLAATLYIGQQCFVIDGDGMYTVTCTAASAQDFIDLLDFFNDAIVQ